MNNDCSHLVTRLRRGKLLKVIKDGQEEKVYVKYDKRRFDDARWIILRAHLPEGAFVEKTYCPHCKWELKIGLWVDKKKENLDEKPLSAIELLQRISASAKP